MPSHGLHNNGVSWKIPSNELSLIQWQEMQCLVAASTPNLADVSLHWTIVLQKGSPATMPTHQSPPKISNYHPCTSPCSITKPKIICGRKNILSPFLFIWLLWIWLCNESPFTDVSSSDGNIDEAFVMEITRFEFWYFCTVFDELPEAILVTQSGYGIQMSTFLVGCYLQHKHIDH